MAPPGGQEYTLLIGSEEERGKHADFTEEVKAGNCLIYNLVCSYQVVTVHSRSVKLRISPHA